MPDNQHLKVDDHGEHCYQDWPRLPCEEDPTGLFDLCYNEVVILPIHFVRICP